MITSYIKTQYLGSIDAFNLQNMSPTYTYDAYDDTQFCTQPAATALGQMTKMVDPSGTTRWCYDVRGRVVKERMTIDGANYDVSDTYDSANRAVALTYPDNETVHQPTTGTAGP